MAEPKNPSPYQRQQKERELATQKATEPKEYACGIMHDSIEEAMVHAEQNLGFRDARGKFVVTLKPLLGTTKFSGGTVIGWQTDPNKRFRVDFEKDYVKKNQQTATRENGVNYGLHGVHVNEENFTRTNKPKICHPTRSQLRDADLLWSRWSSRYGRRGEITAERIAAIEK